MAATTRALACTGWLVAVGAIAVPSASAQTASQPPASDVARTAAKDATPSAAAEAAAPRESIVHVLVGVARGDVKRLRSTRSVTWFSLSAGMAAAAHVFDSDATTAFSAARFKPAFEPGRTLGGGPAIAGGALATYSLGRLTHHARLAATGADLVHAQLLAEAFTLAFKVAVRRERPDGAAYSFPSGHTSVTFASATILQQKFGWKAAVPAFGVASYVAASRVQGRRHYLSDVMFGAALGVFAGRTVMMGPGGGRLAVAPIAGPHAAGISVTWTGNR